ncbi:MAG: hypothetical protein EBS90_12905 [Betaproteobacteria bacterium]|nr:hypothetical protein [Betaproteobacteria bacterium]
MEQINQVWKLLPHIADERDADMAFSEACRLLNAGWTVADTVGFLSCLQEVNPDAPEEESLDRMVQLQAKYR